MPTNFERWKIYTSGLSSPENFLDWGWLYLIAASLQRRVWISAKHQKCFANEYTILVGPPGVGKGLVIGAVTGILTHWKLKDRKINLDGVDSAQAQTANITTDEDLKKAQEREMQPKNKKNEYIEPLLFPMAADATTYEALVEAVAESYRNINYVEFDPKTQQKKIKIYGHSSICFSLPELSSLLRARTNDTVNYMLGLFDCPDDYIYSTKTKGKDRVRRGCLNLLAGTTPHFMQEIFNDGLVDEGLSSRTFFIHATKNRKTQFFIPDLTEEQEGYRRDLCEHVRKLSCLYGKVELTQECIEFLENWWKEFNDTLLQNQKLSPKILPFCARLNIHVMKIAMAMHFGESLEYNIPIETFQRAIDFVLKEMKSMHYALMMESTNIISKIADKIEEYLRSGPKDWIEVLTEFRGMGKKDELEEALCLLQEMGKMEVENEIDQDTEKTIVKYKLK